MMIETNVSSMSTNISLHLVHVTQQVSENCFALDEKASHTDSIHTSNPVTKDLNLLLLFMKAAEEEINIIFITLNTSGQSSSARNICKFIKCVLCPSIYTYSMYSSFSGFGTYSKLPGTKPPFKDSEVVDEQAATEGIFHV